MGFQLIHNIKTIQDICLFVSTGGQFVHAVILPFSIEYTVWLVIQMFTIFDAQKYPHASTQLYNDMPTNLPKFYPFKISSILYFLPIFFKYSIVDSCNVLMYAANCVTSIGFK